MNIQPWITWTQTPLFNAAGENVTLGGLIAGLAIILLGLFFAKRITHSVVNKTLTEDKHSRATRSTVESVVFYLLLITVLLSGLQVAGIPLTAFTVFGGALALGLGFGSQNAVNNFISGLILMIERPIKVGDFIEVDDVFGEVEHIGPRSTRVRTYGNRHILVPNSSFLERNVVNWTHSDAHVRLSVSVGVAYGSDTAKVKALLIEAALTDDRTTKNENKPPLVLFTDFGDNALNFQVLFWIDLMILNDRRIIESNTRFKIDELFREAGISISFPQRDVHLDSAEPLKIEVIKPN